MARPTHVPKFGNFDANEEVPYTVVFDKARAMKAAPGTGKPINPNDPSENPAAFGLKQDNPPSGSGEQGPDRKGRPTGREPYAAPPRVPPRTPERAAGVPKFGDWDENDPSAGEGFTMIFTKAKVEKDAGGPSHIPALRNDNPVTSGPNNTYKQQAPDAEPKKQKSSCWNCCSVL